MPELKADEDDGFYRQHSASSTPRESMSHYDPRASMSLYPPTDYNPDRRESLVSSEYSGHERAVWPMPMQQMSVQPQMVQPQGMPYGLSTGMRGSVYSQGY
ncbi:hypothetical protein RQP46_003931 [Phenoliferia psychrophenolica]